MKTKNLISYLAEAQFVEKINQTVDGSVSRNVLDTLSSKMKSNKFGDKYYDNVAMSIIKFYSKVYQNKEFKIWDEYDDTISEFTIDRKLRESLLDYMNNNSGKLYYILSLMKKQGENIDDFLSNSVNMMRKSEIFEKTDEGISKFFMNEYKKTRSGSEKKKYVPSDTNFRITDGDEFFFYFPRNHYKIDELGRSERDNVRSQQELRNLSLKLAALDTSKEKGAKENHWCVATSNKENGLDYYGEHYKNSIYAVAVKKDKDGKPNFNLRYLMAFKPNGRYELADKFNIHYEKYVVFDSKDEKIIDSIADATLYKNREKYSETKRELQRIRERAGDKLQSAEFENIELINEAIKEKMLYIVKKLVSDNSEVKSIIYEIAKKRREFNKNYIVDGKKINMSVYNMSSGNTLRNQDWFLEFRIGFVSISFLFTYRHNEGSTIIKWINGLGTTSIHIENDIGYYNFSPESAKMSSNLNGQEKRYFDRAFRIRNLSPEDRKLTKNMPYSSIYNSIKKARTDISKGKKITTGLGDDSFVLYKENGGYVVYFKGKSIGRLDADDFKQKIDSIKSQI